MAIYTEENQTETKPNWPWPMRGDQPAGNKEAKVSPTGGLRYNSGKLRLELLPPEVEIALAEVLTKGAEKYEDRNWEKGLWYMDCVGCLKRHVNAWLMGEEIDKESGLHHLKHALTNLAFLVTFIERNMSSFLDDRPFKKSEDKI